MSPSTSEPASSAHPAVTFVTLVCSPEDQDNVRLLSRSLRSFGGELSTCPLWVFTANPQQVPGTGLAGAGVQVFPLEGGPPGVKDYLFGAKVLACAQAEERAADQAALVWVDPQCLVLRPPLHYLLGAPYAAALRPVHIRNVGLLAAGEVDAYWQAIYAAVGVSDVSFTVESFVDEQCLRAYFNTHTFAIQPGRGLLQRWLAGFANLVSDAKFQAGACSDGRHQVFLHQAVLSALLASALPAEQIHLLPPDYNYPYNLHAVVPAGRRATCFNDLTLPVYEERSLYPPAMSDIQVEEPLRSWLLEHARHMAPLPG